MAPRSKQTPIEEQEDATGPPLLAGTPLAVRRMSRETTTSHLDNNESRSERRRPDANLAV